MQKSSNTFFAILIALIFPVLFYLNRVPYTFYWIGLVLVLAVPRIGRARALMLVSLILSFFAPRIFTYGVFGALDKEEAGYINGLVSQADHPWLFMLASGLVPLVLLFVVFAFARFATRQSSSVKNWIKLLLPVVAVALLGISRHSTILLLFALTLGFCTWMIVLSLGDRTVERLYDSHKNFWFYTVFFWRDPLPHFPLQSLNDAIAAESKPPVEYRKLFFTCVEILAASVLVRLSGWFVFSYMGLQDPWLTGTMSFIEHSPSVFDGWLVIATLAFRFIVRSTVIGALAVITLALFGAIPVFNVNQPWRAKSFHEFIGRSMYFYNLALTTAYWPVFLKPLRKLGLPDRLRIALLVFFSAVYFSFFYHLMRGHQFLVSNGVVSGVMQYTNSMAPYVVLFSLCLALSVGLPKVWRWGEHSRALHTAKLLIFFLAYSFLFSLIINFESEGFGHRLALMKFLLMGIR